VLFKVTLRSAWHHKRLLGVTLITSWLITGFCALIPLFLSTLSEAAAHRIVHNIREEMTTLTLYNPRPFAPEALTIIERELGDVIIDKIAFSRAIGSPPYPTLGKICGYDYERGQYLTARSRYAVQTSDHCYKIFSFAALTDMFRLAEGRWPQELNPEIPKPPMIMDEAQIEAVVSTEIAQTAGLKIGDYLVVGDSPDKALVVMIVGLVEPVLPPDNLFWHANAVVRTGEWTQIGDDMRFEVALIVPDESFERWIMPRHEPYVNYYWWLSTSPDTVNSENLKTLEASLYRVERDLRASYPQLELVSGLKTITEQFQADIDRFERPVWVLAGAVLVLMAYQVLVITRLALEETRNEQAVITNRGASMGQQVVIRSGGIGLAVLTSLWVGPLLARAGLGILLHVGPLSALPEGHTTADSLAGAYAGAGGLFLLLVAIVWYTARFPAAHPESGRPDKPLWRRYFLDLLLIALGIAFLLRLYFSTTGDMRRSIEALWQSPAVLADQIGAGEQAREGGLGDPFNLAGPVLILVGIALLWLRIYSLSARLAGPVLRRQKGLTIPMAAWQTARNAGHYTPLVVMLTATLVLGVVSMALDSTYDTRARMMAQQETGADVRLEYEQIESGWETLPGVNDSAVLMRLMASEQIVLVGIDPGSSFPGLKEAADQLAGQSSILPGWVLPEDTVALQLQVYTPEEAQNTTTTRLELQLVDARGVPFTVPMSSADPSVMGRFITFSARLPAESTAWRLIGFRMGSVREGTATFTHKIYVDDLAVVNGQGTRTVLEDFEQAAASDQWMGAVGQSATALETALSADQAASGTASLSVDYRIRHAEVRELQPLLMVHEVAIPQVPLVVSEAFADWQKRQSGTEQNLAVGDTGRVHFDLAVGRFWLSYRVVGIVEEFPTAEPTDRLMVAPFGDLRVALNAQGKPGRYYDANQAWLVLDAAKPSEAFRESAAHLVNVANVLYAWDRYTDRRREPALKAVTGALFAAFWFAWGLYTLTHLVVLASHRTPRTLSILGLDRHQLRRLWAAEQTILFVPTLAFGALVSVLLVYLLLPFLTLIESDTLYLSRASLGAILLMGLTLILPVMVVAAVRGSEQGKA
jgi:hypothetical protein